jgi:redox-sensitive bicupin YhaK (pirin superfamily)
MSDDPVLKIAALGFPWPTIDPFLFCVYHDDAYPAANAQMGPKASLTDRNLGSDFSRKDGWSMYHGNVVPGFPAHPHRGFETVTIVRQGLIDHADSLGAKARFGSGDVQWLTAGRGVVHSEMFPLLKQDQDNPLELFQIWLNLPARSKMSEPYFKMLWAENIPRATLLDSLGGLTEVAFIAGTPPVGSIDAAMVGRFDETVAPPPDSWATQDSSLAIWTIKMAPDSRCTLPAAPAEGAQRVLYFFKGATVDVADRHIDAHCAVTLRAGNAVCLVNGPETSEFLMLQGRPIAEPVVQHGPFVMNTPGEITAAMSEYRRTQFGGWPWPGEAPVHGSDPARRASVPGLPDNLPPKAA